MVYKKSSSVNITLDVQSMDTDFHKSHFHQRPFFGYRFDHNLQEVEKEAEEAKKEEGNKMITLKGML
jgi:hypothetical protein